MIQTITHIMIISSLIIFGIALIICLFRLIKGPTTADRVVTFDTTSAVVMSIVGVLSVLMGTVSFLDSIMLIAIISFVSSISISRFIGGGGMCLMEITKEIFSLIVAVMLLLGSFIALISAIGIVKFQDVFLRSHATTKSSTLSVLLTLIGVLIYFIVNTGFFSVRLLLSLVFINLTSPVGMHLVARAAYRNGAYMYRKNDDHTHASILLSSNEQNSTEALQLRAKKREEHRKKWYQND
ncbi:hypothetical protein CD170_06080 [Staphylococcus aureus]|nr:hypothetical protein CD170_06080 [Staphylococcus aureus]